MELLIQAIHVVENLVLLSLLGLSVWSAGIIIERRRFFKATSDEKTLGDYLKIVNEKSKKEILDWLQNRSSPIAITLKQLLSIDDSNPERFEISDRKVKSVFGELRPEFEKGLTVLATLGSNAPFIGLFGTVLGIIKAFAALSNGQSDPNAVMSGISLALIATALGLFVAIPALIAFNFYSRRLKVIFSNCESVKEAYLSRSKK